MVIGGNDPAPAPSADPGIDPGANPSVGEPVDPAPIDPQPNDPPPVDSPPRPPPVEPPDETEAEPAGVLRGILAAHNAYRASHCAPPLSWSSELAAVAQRWAHELRDAGCAFEHSPDSDFGENLAYASPAGTHSATSVTRNWYREVELYDFGAGKFSFETGHFTQVVWARTRQLGCGYAVCGDGAAELWVCNYDPPGNVSGRFRANVKPTSCR